MKVIPTASIDIYTPTTEESNNSKSYVVKNSEYYIKPNNAFGVQQYSHFSYLVNDDGSLWEDGNRYLLWKVRMNHTVSSTTLLSIANKLKLYKEFCDKERIDYLIAPKKYRRPNWLYRESLMKRIGKPKHENGLESSTVKSHMSEINNFHQWLIDVKGVNYAYDLWEKSEFYISYSDRHGFKHGKKVESKDASQVPSSANDQDGTIFDGEKLKPLLEEEQLALLDALEELDNPEMKIGFLIALTTGARMQTVFTLRLKHFIKDLPTNFSHTNEWIKTLDSVNDSDEIEVLVGPGTGCDTKGSKLYKLFFPGWLYKHIRIYIASQRAWDRREKAISQKSDLDQYIFLTQKNSQPFYASKEDINKNKYSVLPSGNAVRNFLYTKIKNTLKKNGHKFSFKFHDLRATFGMNFIDANIHLTKEKGSGITELYLIEKLQERMAHSDINTTMRYLNFRNMQKLKRAAQNKYERKMKGIL